VIAARRLLAPLILVSVIGSLALAASASAATIFVTTPTDEDGPPNGSCSLREAINSADTDTAIGGCSAGDGADAISTPNAPGQINLDPDLGPLFIQSELSITGSGSGRLTIRGPGNDRVLRVAPGAIVQITGVRIEDGAVSDIDFAAGGGIFNEGDLTLIDVTVADNSVLTAAAGSDAQALGGGIFNNNGTLTLILSTVTGNTAEAFDGDTPGLGATVRGAGIVSFGPLHITYSTVSGNVGTALDGSGTDPGDAAEADGGGIFASSTVTLGQSTISGNSATATSGQRESRAWGGGVYANQDGAIELSTIADNEISAAGATSFSPRGGGIFATGLGEVFVRGSTITGNGGVSGIFGANIDANLTTLTSTIVSHPRGAQSCRAPVNSGGFNIDEAFSCGFSGLADRNGISPMLDPAGLADNGGPTETIRPLPGSPAIDQGDSVGQTDTTHDQRGLERPVDVPTGGDAGDGSDIGAYEAQAPDPPSFASTNPVSPDNNEVTPLVRGAAPDAESVTIFVNADCTSSSGTGTAADFAGAGVEAGVGANSLTTLYGISLNAYGIYSPCSSVLPEDGSIAYRHDSIAPQTTITGYVLEPTPSFDYYATDADPSPAFQCSIDKGTPSYVPCEGGGYTQSNPQYGSQTFRVKAIDWAGNEELTPSTQAFTLAPPALDPTGQRGAALKKCKKVKQKQKRKKCQRRARRLPL
jgi:CSLREA domain-containing protein